MLRPLPSLCLSMSHPILHFAHANSYPAGTYGMFFEQLRAHLRCACLADPRPQSALPGR
jgi:hypothetical protein